MSHIGKQFNVDIIEALCKSFGIQQYFSLPYHPHANGQAGVINMTIINTLKKLLRKYKGKCVE